MRHTIAGVAAIAAPILMLLACTQDTGPYEDTIEIDSHMSPCTGPRNVVTLCFEVKEAGARDWYTRYMPLDGFKYAWGTQYTLRVLVTILDEPRNDWPVLTELLEVKSRSDVPRTSSFRMQLQDPGKQLTKTGDLTWLVLDKEPLVCEPSLCETVGNRVAAGLPVTLTFDHLNSPTGPLHLIAIE